MMSLRLLIVREHSSIKEHLKKIFVASASCGVAYFLLEPANIGDFYKAVAYGIIGVTSPEIIEGMVKIAKSFSRNPEHYLHKDKEQPDDKDWDK